VYSQLAAMWHPLRNDGNKRQRLLAMASKARENDNGVNNDGNGRRKLIPNNGVSVNAYLASENNMAGLAYRKRRRS